MDDDNIPNEANDGEWIACNYLSYYDGCAYADWCGLRPMTELEYEKACRGPSAPGSGQYANGTASFTALAGLTNPGTISEAPSSGNMAINSGGGVGPKRVGLCATSTSTSRLSSGATYYGILDMSGNLYEHVIDATGGATALAFTGNNGDGVLTNIGNSNVALWPGANSDTQTATHQIIRGGSWLSISARAVVSDRSNANTNITTRVSDVGFRLVRSE